MPFTQIHLHAYFGWDRDPGAIQYVYIFSIIALFVLLIACINFMNLSTARSANRAKEVGLRKVVGAQKHHLIRQFYGESIVYAFIALVFASILVTILLPVFSKLAGKELTWNVAGIGPLFTGHRRELSRVVFIHFSTCKSPERRLKIRSGKFHFSKNFGRCSILAVYPPYHRNNNRL